MPDNFLAPFPLPEMRRAYVALPPHIYDDSGRCAFCRDTPTQHTYDSYVAGWYDREWEGARSHKPTPETEWVWLYATCLATPVSH